MRMSQCKWDPSEDIIKSKSCFDRIFYSEKIQVKHIPSKPLKPVAQKLKLSKNYSNQKPVSSRSLKSLKLKEIRNKKLINLQEIKKRFSQAKNNENNENKKMKIQANPYLTANTLQNSLISFKIYEQRQNMQNMLSSRRYSAINSYRQNFQNSNVSLNIVSQKSSNQFKDQREQKNYYGSYFGSPEIDKKLLSSTRINTINSSAFASKNSFYKDEVCIDEEKSDQYKSILLQNDSRMSEQKLTQVQKAFQTQKQQNLTSLLARKKGLISPGHIRLISARQVQTIQSIKTQESLVSEIQQSQGRNSQINSNIFHRILALKKY